MVFHAVRPARGFTTPYTRLGWGFKWSVGIRVQAIGLMIQVECGDMGASNWAEGSSRAWGSGCKQLG